MAATVEGHYSTGRLLQKILDALQEAGHDPDKLDPDALAPVEEFHLMGRPASVALAEAAGITAADRVLDVGSGIGGPARFLRRNYGCAVTGIDLTEEFCAVAVDLNARSGVTEGIEIRQADALDLPFPDDSFDVAWSQHVAMNIADKAGLYRELHRVVRPGGRLAFFDIMAGPAQPLHFPVPWAAVPEISFVVPPEEVRAAVEGAGFTVSVWDDVTADVPAFFEKAAAMPPSPLGLKVMIEDFPTRFGNVKRNFEEDRLRIIRCVATA